MQCEPHTQHPRSNNMGPDRALWAPWGPHGALKGRGEGEGEGKRKREREREKLIQVLHMLHYSDHTQQHCYFGVQNTPSPGE